jgi:hypothetical protein
LNEFSLEYKYWFVITIFQYIMNVLWNKSKYWCDMCHDVSECSCGLLLLLSGNIEYTWCYFSIHQVSVLYLFTQWYSSYCAHFVINRNHILTVHTVIQLQMHALCVTNNHCCASCGIHSLPTLPIDILIFLTSGSSQSHMIPFL